MGGGGGGWHEVVLLSQEEGCYKNNPQGYAECPRQCWIPKSKTKLSIKKLVGVIVVHGGYSGLSLVWAFEATLPRNMWYKINIWY